MPVVRQLDWSPDLAIFDLFSKRARRLRGEAKDVYQYEVLPPEFRAQVVHILTDLFGDPNAYNSRTEDAFKAMHDVLCREYGRFRLSKRFEGPGYWCAAVFDFVMTAPTEEVLDLVEIAIPFVTGLSGDWHFNNYSKPAMTPDAAVAELNARFQERGIGFQYEGGKVVRVDSQVLHAEAVKPALSLLADSDFAGANSEFMKAHEHHRHGRHAECINECLKALESTLKTICHKRKWAHQDTDTAKALIDVVFAQGLVPSWLQSEFTALRATLESGVPTGRNRTSGHGQGVVLRVVPPHLASYVLHLTASAIVFLVESNNAA